MGLHLLPDEETQLSWALLTSMPQSRIPPWAVDASMRSLKATEERQLSWALDESMSSLDVSQSMAKDQPKPGDEGKLKEKDKPQEKGKLKDKPKDTDMDKHCSIEVPTWVLRSLKASQSNARVRPRPKPGPKPDQL